MKKYFSLLSLGSFFIWVISCAAFVIGQVRAPSNYAVLPGNPWGKFFGISVLTGIGTFISGIVFGILAGINKGQVKPKKKVIKTVSKEDISLNRSTTIAIIVSILGIVFMLFTVFRNFIVSDNSSARQFTDPIVTKTPTSTPTPTVKPKAVVSDPVVDCISSAQNCNGESIRLRQSQCKNITCCQVGNTWSVYSSSDKCKTAQEASKPAATAAPQGRTFQCWNNTTGQFYYTSSGDQCNQDNQRASLIKSCIDLQNTITSGCNDGCKYQTNVDFQVCLNNCTDAFEIGMDKCYKY